MATYYHEAVFLQASMLYFEPHCSWEDLMLDLVYREDTNGVRYLVCGDVSKNEAQETLQRLTSGKSHKQDYEIVAYEPHALKQVLQEKHIIS